MTGNDRPAGSKRKADGLRLAVLAVRQTADDAAFGKTFLADARPAREALPQRGGGRRPAAQHQEAPSRVHHFWYGETMLLCTKGKLPAGKSLDLYQSMPIADHG